MNASIAPEAQEIEQYDDASSHRMEQINFLFDNKVSQSKLVNKLRNLDPKIQPVEILQTALDLMVLQGTKDPFEQENPLVRYTTKKQKILEGIIIPFEKVKRLSDAKNLDPYTFAYNKTGWFIRLKHLPNIDNSLLTDQQIQLKEKSNAKNSATDPNNASQVRAGSGGQGSSSDEQPSTRSMAEQAITGDDAGELTIDRVGNSSISDSDGSGVGSGSNRKSSGPRKRSFTRASASTNDGGSSNLSDDKRSSTRAKRDRSTLHAAHSLRAELKGKELLQQKADGIETKWGDLDSIQSALPFLMTEQQEDVFKAEKHLIEKKQNGIVFTNGTGTGKTFTGLGVVKRFLNAGKKRIIIVSMNDKIIRDFVKSAKALQINVHQLDGINDNGGKDHNIIATTYANFAQNTKITLKKWDLIIVDESHNLMQSQEGKKTGALAKLQALTGHHAGFYQWFDEHFQDEMPPRKLVETPLLDANGKEILDDNGDAQYELKESKEYVPGPKTDQWFEKQDKYREKWKEDWSKQSPDRTKVVFLSATPFSYVRTLEWAEGFLFHYTDPKDLYSNATASKGLRYNSGNDRQHFYMSNFGYTMRYNKMTRPDGKVDSGINERNFAEKLKESGAMTGRELTVPFDYDRKFILVESAVGEQIDKGLEILSSEKDDNDRGMFWHLSSIIRKRFDYLSRERLLEAIKAIDAIKQIKKSIALGRKVVVFHDYNFGGGFKPFQPSEKLMGALQHPNEKVLIEAEYDVFSRKYPNLANLELNYPSPIQTLKSAFPNALLFNGTVSKGQRAKNADLFNTDENGHDLIIVQSDAGATGISFHDTTGKHQRVIFNLGLPKRPAKLRQTEGRIYRVGQASNAIHRYFTTGTQWETQAFANVIAQRAETVDNLAKGDDAVVSIRDAIIQAYSDAEYFEPSLKDGVGGKAYDEENARIARLSPFDKAKTYYYNKGKNRDKRSQKIGKDWYATPEPLGLKMVQWSGAHNGDDVLEPSAGDGAIGRWIPETANATMVEPSTELAARAKLSNASATVHEGAFEDHNTMIKYDAIVMNPPFGHSGKTAGDHVFKAVQHLRDGGRIVALIPCAKALDNRLDQFIIDNPSIHMLASIQLPESTFTNASTNVRTRIIILEKHENDDDIYIATRHLNFDHIESVDELFEKIEGVSFKPRKLRNDESLLEYGLILSPYRKSHILTGVGIHTPEIRKVLDEEYYIYKVANDNDSLECHGRNTTKLLKALKQENAPKIMPHKHEVIF